MLQTYNAKTAAAQLAIHLRFARNECVTRKIPYRVIIKSKAAPSGANTYVVQYDPSLTNSFQTVPDLDFHVPRGVEFPDTPVFSGGQATITFTTRGRATANGSTPYNVQVQAVNGNTYRILIQNTGIVNWEKA